MPRKSLQGRQRSQGVGHATKAPERELPALDGLMCAFVGRSDAGHGPRVCTSLGEREHQRVRVDGPCRVLIDHAPRCELMHLAKVCALHV